jgi:hypothetical protein
VPGARLRQRHEYQPILDQFDAMYIDKVKVTAYFINIRQTWNRDE